MYYPFLRARQFELIAVRDLVKENALNEKIIPVFEPTKEDVGNLNLAHPVFKEFGFKSFLIMNPQVGKYAKNLNYFLDYLSSLEDPCFYPAFIFVDNVDYIRESIRSYNLQNCMIIGLDSFSNEDGFKDICSVPEVTDVMILDPGKFRSIDRFVRGLNKNYIRLDDLFEKQSRNSDYLEIPPHKFSEEHLFFDAENFDGFSDFTTLPFDYVEGGSTPRAVVIHLTYLNQEEEEQIWIRHFTSENNDSIANVQGKFAQASDKALAFCKEYNLDNSAIRELWKYFVDEKYPGLGTVKKISIKNHLLVLKSFLSNE